MAFTNKQKNEWTISLLQLQKTDNVLEISFGPGVSTKSVANIITDGYYVGIDYSDVMLQQAKKRNLNGIKEGRIHLICADVSHMPKLDQMFDKAFSINSVIFWADPVTSLKGIRQVLKPNGVIALTVLPYEKNATEETTMELGRKIRHYLERAGFCNIRIERKEMKPAPAVCVLGYNGLNSKIEISKKK